MYTNNIPLALNNMGLLITTRYEIEQLVQRHEAMFLEALKRCFVKRKGRNEHRDPLATHPEDQDESRKERRRHILDQIELDYNNSWHWLRRDLSKWLKSIRKASTSCVHQVIACVDMTHAEAEFLINSCLKLNRHFDAIISSASLPKPKPHPQVYQNAMRELKLDPNTNVICVEASLEGIIAAKMAGIMCILAVRLETPLQKQKERMLVADHEDQVREETMQMLSEGAFTVIRDLEHLRGEYLSSIFVACQRSNEQQERMSRIDDARSDGESEEVCATEVKEGSG